MSLGFTNRILGPLNNFCQLCDQTIRLKKTVITKVLVGIKKANVFPGSWKIQIVYDSAQCTDLLYLVSVYLKLLATYRYFFIFNCGKKKTHNIKFTISAIFKCTFHQC